MIAGRIMSIRFSPNVYVNVSRYVGNSFPKEKNVNASGAAITITMTDNAAITLCS